MFLEDKKVPIRKFDLSLLKS